MLTQYLKEHNWHLIEESIKVHPQQNRDITTNYFQSYKPKGIYLYDSYNNDMFPYKRIVFDKATFDLPQYHRFLNALFGIELVYLPFHFFIEFIDNDYYVINTRPIIMKPLIPNDIKTEYNDYIHICVLGDSNSDIYSRQMYQKLRSLLNSLFILFKWGKLNKNKIVSHMGKNFFLDNLLNK